MSDLSYIIELSIATGKLDEFKSKAAGFIQSVEANEPGTLTYKWHMSEDGTKCILHEAFTDSEALLTHLANVGPTLPDLLAISPITRFEVLGDASSDAVDALKPLGAVFFPQVHGFERS